MPSANELSAPMSVIARYGRTLSAPFSMQVDELPAGGGDDSASYRYVKQTATGNGSGMDWTNAMGANFTPVRGLIYWLADGDYGSKTFGAAPNGTQAITIRKATVANHGTNTGWSDALGDGQAIFGFCNITTSYWNFDGQRRNANWHTGAISEYGIRFKVTGGKTIVLTNAITNLTFDYCDLECGGRDTGDTSGSDVIYGLSGPDNITFRRCALHDSNRTIFLMRGGWGNLLIERCWIARNASHPLDAQGGHGEFMSVTDATNLVARYNYFEDIEGSAVIAGINGGLLNGAQIYGNVFHWTDAYWNNTGRDSTHNFGVAGVMFIANDASNNNTAANVKFFNNSVYRCPGSYSGIIIQSSPAGGNEVRNNIWDSCVRTNNSFSGTISHNWYRNTPVDGDNTATRQNGTSLPFANVSAKDFHLASNTSAGLTLAAPFDVDMDGVVRSTWSRGAFEMV